MIYLSSFNIYLKKNWFQRITNSNICMYLKSVTSDVTSFIIINIFISNCHLMTLTHLLLHVTSYSPTLETMMRCLRDHTSQFCLSLISRSIYVVYKLNCWPAASISAEKNKQPQQRGYVYFPSFPLSCL